MWFLYALQNGQDAQRILLRPGLLYSIGRKGADIMPLIAEKSISRRHATLKIEPINAQHMIDINYRPYVWFHDLGSKFGSYVNSIRVEGDALDQGIYMKDGDILKMGTRSCQFRLCWEPLIISRQTMTQMDKQKLYEAAQKIGAKITQSVRSSYTHVLVTTIQMSFKVARCLADVKPIVSQEWLDALVALPDVDFKFPSTDDYMPPTDDSCRGPLGIPDFRPNPRRSTLFTNKRFIFFEEKQYQSMSPLVNACKGTSELLNTKTADPFEDNLNADDVIVVDSECLSDTHGGQNIVFALDSVQRRPVDQMEICWAIAYCSIDTHCNARTDASAVAAISSIKNASRSTSARAQSSSRATHNGSVVTAKSSSPIIYQTPIPPSTSTSNLSASMKRDQSIITQATDRKAKTMDLDDLFDDLIGDDPPLPPPITNNSNINEASTAGNHHKKFSPMAPQRQDDQPSTPLSSSSASAAATPANHSSSNIATDGISVDSTTVLRRRRSDSPLDNSHQTVASSTSKRQKTNQHRDPAESLIKGKERLLQIVEGTDADDNNNNSSTDMNNTFSNSDLSRDIPQSNKQSRPSKSSSTTSTTIRTPYTLPELENENTEIISGKQYTKVNYISMVVSNEPQRTVQATRQQSPNQINYKRFKKASHPIPADPLYFISMSTEVHSNPRGI
ncbi:uncharacterized protein BX664DRAFT_329566 [Halteromyces radiatus]|uniref:uncharacterized protein n=1 Tax=Halteromyces radiatus TaxID=101107 RepID=UPI00221FD460|nr:uncharacterized protein BX664DRAFT_329566 [Halteromyces radiatus]KAI8093381.1 hypothetical protein BX664DRAFT_329566 [Halteromyces radiatus]